MKPDTLDAVARQDAPCAAHVRGSSPGRPPASERVIAKDRTAKPSEEPERHERRAQRPKPAPCPSAPSEFPLARQKKKPSTTSVHCERTMLV